jgi:two-component system sensor histidine kinase PilS (NtrC family)
VPRGLWGTVGFAFLATAVYGLVLPRVRNGTRFAAVNIATDVAIVSGLVGFSGGVDSVFAFLFVLVAVYGALLFERRGALATAALAVSALGLVLFAADTGWLPVAPSARLDRARWCSRCGPSTPGRCCWWRCSRACSEPS